jgi:hypothetical protein
MLVMLIRALGFVDSFPGPPLVIAEVADELAVAAGAFAERLPIWILI